MPSKKLTILFAPIDAVGPVNALTGIAEPLQACGHRIVFAVKHGWKGKLSPLGFEEEYTGDPPTSSDSAPSATWTEIMTSWKPWLRQTPLEQYATIGTSGFRNCFDETREADIFYGPIIARVRPDLIVTESIAPSPAIINSGLPYIYVNSNQPLCMLGVGIPPPFSGLPTDGDRSQWKKYEDEFWAAMEPVRAEMNEWLKENKCDYRMTRELVFPKSPFCNVYMTPKELSYGDEKLPGWHRFDNFMRTESNLADLVLPEEFLARPGKLVYFSMGSIGSADVELMNRLLVILARSPNKFVVSKGPLHDQITLADNMFGQPSLPQTKVLQMFDLVVHHGGNNTTTETLAWGKPAIVLPLFLDQFDNATRVAETGYGIRLNPFTVSESGLLDAVEGMLSDEDVQERCRVAGERIRAAKNTEKAADLVEEIAEKYVK